MASRSPRRDASKFLRRPARARGNAVMRARGTIGSTGLSRLASPELFFSIGEWYAEFSQTPDAEVAALLTKAAERTERKVMVPREQPGARVSAAPDPPAFEREILVEAGDVLLPARVTVPDRAAGVVIFAHGSGSSRRSGS
jgi:putative phosphoribosyl transferase